VAVVEAHHAGDLGVVASLALDDDMRRILSEEM